MYTQPWRKVIHFVAGKNTSEFIWKGVCEAFSRVDIQQNSASWVVRVDADPRFNHSTVKNSWKVETLIENLLK